MIKFYTVFILILLVSKKITAQISLKKSTNDWLNNWVSFNPQIERYPTADVILPNVISKDTFLSNENTYLLTGNTFVTENATLSIEKGVIIRCDTKKSTSLLITKGAKLIAEGTEKYPIIFTSSKKERTRSSGDWGGIIILGSGKINTAVGVATVEGNFNPAYSTIYGGNNFEEETAIMRYVRIEFPGKKINSHKELNGLSLCAIGSSTILENIMVSYSLDDSFEWYGGSGEFKNLVSYKAKDDDYDITFGFNGKLINPVAIRHPYISDISGSYSLEIDGYDKDQGLSSKSKLSCLTVNNGTFINLANKDNVNFTASAISVKKMAHLNMHNSSISGFLNVIKLDNSYKNKTWDLIRENLLFSNNIFNVKEGKKINIENSSKFNFSKFFKTNRFTKFYLNPNEIFLNPTDEDQPSFEMKKVSLYTML